MRCPIAVVGMACRYPDADTPGALWENVLAQRRAFRRLPDERLRLEDYYAADRSIPDRTYSMQAAVIEGYEFDRVAFRVAGTTFRSADHAHWLALDVASEALADAGAADAEGLPRPSTGVVLGNTLTGEFSRANVMRLRWPYVRRVLDEQLANEGWSERDRGRFMAGMEVSYKSAFPPIGEESLAGGLSNTIAGRICNHFDLKGGGYTVDGACAASLLAVTTACSSLAAGDLDVALAGGVDLSLDPFELVGFAKTGALAEDLMRVYDRGSAGFWPGEGCGFVVLMRLDDALEQRRRIYSVVQGWGVSSDGGGGITRPTIEGQLLAVRRAYRRAGYGVETVPYFEGHGTGTKVGDANELAVLSEARRESSADGSWERAIVGTIKGNIGHTKAAAGIAGFLKATLAVHHRMLPPTTGCFDPHPLLCGEDAVLGVLDAARRWPGDRPLRASVSAMGFGGINTHVAIEGAEPRAHRPAIDETMRRYLRAPQDAEILLFGGDDIDDLRRQVERVHAFAGRVSMSELGDLAAALAGAVAARQCRAAVVATRPAEAESRLGDLVAALESGATSRVDLAGGVYLGGGVVAPRIGFLFPGQAAPVYRDGGVWARRFDEVAALYDEITLPETEDDVSTAIAQPAIAASSISALRVLDRIGLDAGAAVGHSLGELVALGWAGAYDDITLVRIATARGRAMTDLGAETGAMASLGAAPERVADLIGGLPLVISNYNSPVKTVVSGERDAVETAIERARSARVAAVRLPVSHAFHSALVAAAAPALSERLATESISPVERTIFSTVTGAVIERSTDLRDLLRDQVTAPVRFTEAASRLAGECDLLIEVGPGRIMTRLMADIAAKPVIPLESGSRSLAGLLHAAGAAYAMGAPLRPEALFEDRFTRPFDLEWAPRFFESPCEQAPADAPTAEAAAEPVPVAAAALETVAGANGSGATDGRDAREVIRELVARRAELPIASVADDDRFLSDLHLNSITVGQLLGEAARQLGQPSPASPTDYADATVAEAATALEEAAAGAAGSGGAARDEARTPAGVESWLRAFTVEAIERPRPRAHPRSVLEAGPGAWTVVAEPEHRLLQRLLPALTRAVPGGGVVVCLPPDPDEQHVDLLLEGAHAAMRNREDGRFVLVQHGGGAASFARTLHMEAPHLTTCVVDVPPDHVDAIDWVVAETASGTGYREARYDGDGRRFVPILRLADLEPPGGGAPALGAEDVLLVTGGGKGIAAECALALAREHGVRLVLMGRSSPDGDEELAANLDRLETHGVVFRYFAADVTDADAVAAAIRDAEADLGPVTAFLHGAGRNVPQLIGALDKMAVRRTMAPKLQGARNVLAALDPAALRLFVSFGSIIARIGLDGEADYALANEWMTRMTEQWGRAHEHCRCLALEWSVWSGVGMGQRLGRVDTLLDHGVTPLSPDEGVAFLHRALASRLPATAIVLSGRFGEPPTLRLEGDELPLLRFLERPRVHYPGVELVVDSTITSDTDPYVEDHVFHGERLLPAVVGLEAMAQAAFALSGRAERGVLEDVELSRPIVVPRDGEQGMRVAAVRRESGAVELALRSGESGFQVDHFRARWRAASPDQTDAVTGNDTYTYTYTHTDTDTATHETLAIDPMIDLYGSILFHEGRFRRLRRYRKLSARECEAEITPSPEVPWFAQYLPRELLLGDPALRDAAIHAIQACIPHARLLPIGAERIVLGKLPFDRPCVVHAVERRREGDTFTYDMTIRDTGGSTIERWEGLRLRAVEPIDTSGPWLESLLVPYLERKTEELIPGARTTVAVTHNGVTERPERSDRAIAAAMGHAAPVRRRPDGRPEVPGETRQVSVAHAGALTLAVAGEGPLGCDLEIVDARDATAWQGMLSPDRYALAELLARECHEDRDTSATRVWAAAECLAKAQRPPDAPLTLKASSDDGWIVLASGELRIATYAAPVRGQAALLVFGVLAGQGS